LNQALTFVEHVSRHAASHHSYPLGDQGEQAYLLFQTH